MPGHVREEIADRNTRLTVMLKLPRTGERFAAAVKLRGLHLQPERLAVLLREPGFGIEGIHRGRAAIHVQKNDAWPCVKWAAARANSPPCPALPPSITKPRLLRQPLAQRAILSRRVSGD